MLPSFSVRLRSAKFNGQLCSLLILMLVVVFLIISVLIRANRAETSSSLRNAGTEYYDDFQPIFHPGVHDDESLYFSGIHLREVYRIKDDTLRLVWLQHRHNTNKVLVQLGSEWKPVPYMCFNQTCDDAMECGFSTRIGVVKIPPSFDTPSLLSFTSEGNQEFFDVPVRDVRITSNHTYPHQLGVCVQPIFYYTDWPLIIQFFESWLAQGGTKFYFYLHSYTKQTKHVLDFYKEQLGDDLELISWSDLSVPRRNRGKYRDDPNSHVFRYAATTFMQECMHKARSNVKYVANFDLDDIPFGVGRDLVGILEDRQKKHPDAAQYELDWLLTHQKLRWNEIHTPNDVSLTWTSTRVIERASVEKSYRESGKLIHRPERVLNFDWHTTRQNEKIGSSNERYKHVSLKGDPNIYSLHMRRFPRQMRNSSIIHEPTFDHHQTEELGRLLDENYKKRIQNTTFKDLTMSPWVTEAHETMRNLEQCRMEAFGLNLHEENMCKQSSSGCFGMISGYADFIREPLSWINVENGGVFQKYLE